MAPRPTFAIRFRGCKSGAWPPPRNHSDRSREDSYFEVLLPRGYPGKVVSEELEQESGGSGPRYSFVIHHKQVKHEVGVDAKTGAVLENAVEGKNPD